MLYDPIERFIEIQLGRFHPHYPEDLLIALLDLKYHRQSRFKENLLYLSLQGYTCRDISSMLGCSYVWISKLIRRELVNK